MEVNPPALSVLHTLCYPLHWVSWVFFLCWSQQHGQILPGSGAFHTSWLRKSNAYQAFPPACLWWDISAHEQSTLVIAPSWENSLGFTFLKQHSDKDSCLGAKSGCGASWDGWQHRSFLIPSLWQHHERGQQVHCSVLQMLLRCLQCCSLLLYCHFHRFL